MLVTKIRISWSTSPMAAVTAVDSASPRRSIKRSHRFISGSSFKQIRSLCKKSFRDSAASTSPWLARGDVPQRSNWLAMWLPALVLGNESASLTEFAAKVSNRSSRSYFCSPYARPGVSLTFRAAPLHSMFGVWRSAFVSLNATHSTFPCSSLSMSA
jgi:hypothetical protein